MTSRGIVGGWPPFGPKEGRFMNLVLRPNRFVLQVGTTNPEVDVEMVCNEHDAARYRVRLVYFAGGKLLRMATFETADLFVVNAVVQAARRGEDLPQEALAALAAALPG